MKMNQRLEDYLQGQVSQQDLEKKHGGSNKNEYFLKPSAFKLCLTRKELKKTYEKFKI